MNVFLRVIRPVSTGYVTFLVLAQCGRVARNINANRRSFSTSIQTKASLVPHLVSHTH